MCTGILSENAQRLSSPYSRHSSGASVRQNRLGFYGKSQEEVSHQVWPCMERCRADRVCVAEAPSITNHRPHPSRWLTDSHLLQLGTFHSDENRDVTDSEWTENHMTEEKFCCKMKHRPKIYKLKKYGHSIHRQTRWNRRRKQRGSHSLKNQTDQRGKAPKTQHMVTRSVLATASVCSCVLHKALAAQLWCGH